MSEEPRIGRVRIRIAAPQRPASVRGFPAINWILPTYADAEIFVVGPDGEELALHDVASVSFSAGDGSLEPIVATLKIYPESLEFEGLARFTSAETASETNS